MAILQVYELLIDGIRHAVRYALKENNIQKAESQNTYDKRV
jgi:hypothetical protein